MYLFSCNRLTILSALLSPRYLLSRMLNEIRNINSIDVSRRKFQISAGNGMWNRINFLKISFQNVICDDFLGKHVSRCCLRSCCMFKFKNVNKGIACKIGRINHPNPRNEGLRFYRCFQLPNRLREF